MFGIFTTREVSTAIWTTLFFIFCLYKTKNRNVIFQVIKSVLNRQILIPFILLSLYTVAISSIFLLFNIDINEYIKDIILWFIFAGIPFAYSSILDKDITKKYFLNYIRNNIKIIAVIEFVFSTFTFNIFIELLLIPIISFLVILDTISNSKKECKSVHKLFSMILSLMGFIILFFTLKEALSSFDSFGTINLLISFFIPFIFSVFYVPITYIFVIYSKYQQLFSRMSSRVPYGKETQYRFLIIKHLRLSYKKLKFFISNCLYRMYARMTDEEFMSLINETSTLNIKTK